MPPDSENLSDNHENDGSVGTIVDPIWQEIDRLHSVVQNKTTAYVEQLAKSKNYLERHVGLLLAMLQSIGDGLVVVDQEGDPVLFNEAAAAATGMRIAEMTVKQWADMGIAYAADKVTRLTMEELPIYKAMQGIPAQETLFYRTKREPNGQWMRVHATPIRDEAGKLHGAVAIFHDMTEQLNLIQQRNDLAAIVTHDLKNHLFGETQLLDLLIEELSGNVSAEQEKSLLLLQANSNRQLQIIDRLMEIYRYEIGVEPLHFEITDITPCIASSIAEALPSLKAGGLTFASSLSPTLHPVSADVRALNHVFNNLFGNAIKFTPVGGHVKVESYNVDDDVVVTISDSGQGIPQEELDLLFKGSFHEQRSKKPVGSTGLGLYLCRKILEAHGATITCTSAVGNGSTFVVMLPGKQNP